MRYEDVPEVVKSLAADAPVLVGGTVGAGKGAAIGTALGGPFGGFVGGVIGGGVGSFGGSLVKQGGQALIDSPEAPESVRAALGEAGKEGAWGMAGEGAGRTVVGVGGKLLAPFAKKLLPAAVDVAPEIAARGGSILPAQMTRHPLLDVVQNMAKEAPFGGVPIAKAEEEGIRAWSRWGEEIATKLGREVSDVEAGNLVLKAGEEGITAHRALSDQLYDNISKLMPNGTSKTKLLKNAASDAIDEIAETKGIASTEKYEKLLGKVMAQDDVVEFETAKKIRSELLTMQRDLAGEVGENKAKALLGKLVDGIDTEMANAAQKYSPQAYQAWRKANRFYRYGKETFENKFLATLFIQDKKTPERVAETVFRSGNVDEVIKLKKAMRTAANLSKKFDYNKTWGSLQRNYLENFITSFTSGETGLLNANSFLKALDNPQRSRTLAEIYSGEQLREIRRWASAIQLMTKKQPGGGGMIIKLVQGGALLGMATGQFTKASATVFITPYVMAKMLTNPTSAKWLTYGFKLPANSPMAAGLIGRIGAEVAKIEREQQKEEKPPVPDSVLQLFGQGQ